MRLYDYDIVVKYEDSTKRIHISEYDMETAITKALFEEYPEAEIVRWKYVVPRSDVSFGVKSIWDVICTGHRFTVNVYCEAIAQ